MPLLSPRFVGANADPMLWVLLACADVGTLSTATLSAEMWAVPDGPAGLSATAQVDGIQDADLCPTEENEAEMELVGRAQASGFVLAEYTPESPRGERGGWKLRKTPASCSLAAWSWDHGAMGDVDALRFELRTRSADAAFEADLSPTAHLELIAPPHGSLLEAGQEIELRLPQDAPDQVDGNNTWTPDPVEGCLRGAGEPVKMRVEGDSVFLRVRSDLENHPGDTCQTGLQVSYRAPTEVECGVDVCSFSMSKAIWLDFQVR